MATPKQTDPQFKLRLPAELKDNLDKASQANNRSLNAEMVLRLERSFIDQGYVARIRGTVEDDQAYQERLDSLQRDVEELKKAIKD